VIKGIEAYSNITHPNLVAIREANIDQKRKELCVIYDFVEGANNLQLLYNEILQRKVFIQENDAWSIIIKVMRAL